MKPSVMEQRKNGYLSDDENVRYKLNKQYFNNLPKSSGKSILKETKKESDNDVRYMFPVVTLKSKSAEQKTKVKQKKLKVNFWSSKQNSRLNKTESKLDNSSRRHTIATPSGNSISKPKTSSVKVRKRVSFLPSPLFSENHIPMVTVPDDLTINLNEEEAYDLRDDLNSAFANTINEESKRPHSPKRKSKSSTMQTSPKGTKRKIDESRGPGNEYELEFFSKYVVQKLRRMETNQRIYSENLINTVLMLGQLGKLHGKSKVSDA